MKFSFKMFLLTTFLLITYQILIAQTQGEMNRAASKGYLESKAQLEGTINRINALYGKDQDFIVAFRISNDAWEKYRDAQLKMKFPAINPRNAYGSMYPMCYGSYLEELNRNRIKELRLWADGVNEEEGCSGSVHYKNK